MHGRVQDPLLYIRVLQPHLGLDPYPETTSYDENHLQTRETGDEKQFSSFSNSASIRDTVFPLNPLCKLKNFLLACLFHAVNVSHATRRT